MPIPFKRLQRLYIKRILIQRRLTLVNYRSFKNAVIPVFIGFSVLLSVLLIYRFDNR